MQEILLTNSFKVALIDDEDYEKVNKYYWRIHKVYGYIETGRLKNTIKLQNLILKSKEGFTVDHIDLNKLNNQKNNLRYANSKQQAYNRPVKSNNSSGYKGVSWSSSMHKWRSEITKREIFRKRGKPIVIGYFNTKEDAAIAYNEVAKQLFGEFACLNEI